MRLQLATSPQAAPVAGSRIALPPLDAALLAWLALEGPTPRARLAQLLWPEKDADAARNSLRQRLFQLRKQIGADLVAGSTTLALADGVTHDLDDSDGVLSDLRIEIDGEYGRWLAQQRERRRARVRQSLIELSTMAEQAKDFDDALAHARELLALEPLSEDAHRRVMRLHYLAGDRAAALLAFDRLEQVLKDEVGARPSAETLALLDTLSAPAQAALPACAAVPAAVLRPPRLVGRARELAALSQAWQAGHVVALVGEAGLGKTRLLQEFVERRNGFVRVAGRPGDAGVPFATLARLLRAVVAQEGAAGSVQLAEATRGEIARVLPEFDGGGLRQAGEGQRLVLLRAVRALLQAHARIETVVVDDLHFVDEASLDMLGGLIDGGEEAEPWWRWVLAYRPAEAGSVVQGLHDRLVEQVRLAPIGLAPLDEAALAELVDSLALPGVAGAALAPALLRRTGGNPLFVLETLKQAWVEQSLSRLADAAAMPRPLSVGRLIERRIAQLSPPALALARVASIAEVDFGIALAEHVMQASAVQFADAMNELEASQVLRDMQFAHDLVFDAVRASVPKPVARHVHGRVAEWLEQHGGEPARVARHWIEAAAHSRALPWLDQAAAAAGAAVRRKEQVAFLDQKSRIHEALGDRSAAFDALMRAAEIEVTFDDESTATGLTLCDRLDALACDAAQRVQAGAQRSNLAVMRGEVQLAETVAAAALREALQAGVAAEHVMQCRIALATALSQQTRPADAVVHFEAALTWVDEHGSDGLRCEFHGNLATTYNRLGRFAEAIAHSRRAADLAQRLGDHANQAIVLSNYAAVVAQSGRIAKAGALQAQARLVYAQAAEPSSISGFIAMEEAVQRLQSGRYDEALRTIDDGLENLQRFAPGYANRLRVQRANCWSHLGQWARAGQALDALAQEALPRGLQCRAALLRHRLDSALERPADVTVFDAALGALQRDELLDLRHALELERAMSVGGDAGRRAVSAVIDRARAMEHDATMFVAHACRARLSAECGDATQARADADVAARLGEQVMAVYQYPMQPWLHCAAALQTIGEHAAAAQVAQRARDWIESVLRGHVPAEFRDSFLHRNPVNRELLALAARLTPR